MFKNKDNNFDIKITFNEASNVFSHHIMMIFVKNRIIWTQELLKMDYECSSYELQNFSQNTIQKFQN